MACNHPQVDLQYEVCLGVKCDHMGDFHFLISVGEVQIK